MVLDGGQFDGRGEKVSPQPVTKGFLAAPVRKRPPTGDKNPWRLVEPLAFDPVQALGPCFVALGREVFQAVKVDGARGQGVEVRDGRLGLEDGEVFAFGVSHVV